LLTFTGSLIPPKAILAHDPIPLNTTAGRWLLGLTLGFVWMGVSSGLIILNKQLMSKDGFHYPMALSALGMSFSSVASYFCCRVGLPTSLRPSAIPLALCQEPHGKSQTGIECLSFDKHASCLTEAGAMPAASLCGGHT
jgi:hypothetical protein